MTWAFASARLVRLVKIAETDFVTNRAGLAYHPAAPLKNKGVAKEVCGDKIGVGRAVARSRSLRTGLADFLHPALQSVVSR